MSTSNEPTANMRRGLAIAIVLAGAFRAGVFFFALLQPIPNESGRLVSPLRVSPGIDFGFYANTRDNFFNNSWPEIWESFAVAFEPDHNYSVPGLRYPSAPLFPIVLEVFSYDPGNTLPLAVFYFVLGFALSAAWLLWLYRRGVPTLWLLAFALLPNPVWLTLNVSTDLLFAAFFGIFYWAYFRTGRPVRIWSVLFIGILALLTRPNGVVLILFLIAALSLGDGDFPRRLRWKVIAAAAVLLPPVMLFYRPELKVFAGDPSLYFGASQADYIAGIFNRLPAWLDHGLSFAALVGAKVLYFAGLRPSYGETPMLLVLARAAAGLILVPGIVYLLVRGGRAHQLLTAIYMLPVLLGASQDRYNLAIQPLLFYFGYRAYDWIGAVLMRTVRGGRTDRGETSAP